MTEITFHPDVPQKVQEFALKLDRIRLELSDEADELYKEFYSEAPPDFALLFVIGNKAPGEGKCTTATSAYGHSGMIVPSTIELLHRWQYDQMGGGKG